MPNELIEEPEDDLNTPVPPLTRSQGLLDGLVHCDDCGAELVAAIDSRGLGFYVHVEEIGG